MTTKILALADGLGTLTDFRLLPGQAHDLRGTAALIDGLMCGQLLADRAFDADWLRDALNGAGIEPVIPPKSNRRCPAEFDREAYRWRHLIENFFGKQGVQRHRHALLQDRRKLQRLHLTGSHRHPAEVNVNKP